MDETHDRPDPREAEEGPGGSKLAPAGNSNARIFVPPEQEEKREDQPADEPQDSAPEDDSDS